MRPSTLRLFSTLQDPLHSLVIAVNATRCEVGGAQEEGFSSSLYFATLRNHESSCGRSLLHAGELESTQSMVMQNGIAPDDGVVCVADRQTSGRGRGVNTWDSPLGCLMFSFRCAFPSSAGAKLPFFQYLVSLAAVRAASAASDGKCDVNIKWPNDLYANRLQKIGGILCQSQFEGGRFVVTTGVGLNVENELPTTCLSTLAGRRIRREVVLAEFFNAFDLIYARFLSAHDGPSFELFLDEYHSKWLHTGQRVLVDGESNKFVTVQGLSLATGALLANDDEGKLFELTPDGNRLDFFKGLVSKRVG